VEKLRWKFINLSLLFILLISFTCLANASIQLIPIDNEISVSETAKYTLKVTNEGETTANYKVYSLDLGWMIDPAPTDRTFDLAPGKTKSTTISIKPLEEFKPGAYAPTLYIDEYKKSEYETYTESLKIYLSPDEPADYLPSIMAEIDMNENIDPNEPVSIKLFLENKNPLDLENLLIRIQSDIPEFDTEVEVDLPPLEKKTVESTVTLNKFQEPKEYILFFVFIHNDEQVKILEQRIEIVSLLPPFVNKIEEESVFFKKFMKVTISNDGNVKNEQEINIPITFWQSLFTTVKDDGVIKNDNMVWETSLSPNTTKELHYIINYRILFYIFMTLFFLGSFYWAVQTPIAVKKTAQTAKADEEGTISEIKIQLEVKNKSKKPIKDIEILDIVPGIANVEKSLQLGTLRPKEVKHTKKGTKVVWALAELDGEEHRLISYEIKAKLNIVGDFTLPRATVEFTKSNGKKNRSYSNAYNLNG